MKFKIRENHAVLLKYEGNEKFVKVPASYEGFPLTEIASRAFENNLSINCVDVPETLRVIGDAAFKGCSNLYCINYSLPDTPVEQRMFTENFYYFRLPSSLEKIGSEAFRYTNLNDLSCYSYRLTIGPSAFQNSSCLRQVTLDVCQELHLMPHAFAACKVLTTFLAPKAKSRLDQFAFGQCTNLTTLVLNGEPAYYGNTFHGCAKLQSFRTYDDRFTIDPRTLYQLKPYQEGNNGMD